MNELIKNINPWAEKLEQVAVPDVNEQWEYMHKALDEHMPEKKRGRLIFFFWITLLTFLLVISFFFGMKYSSRNLEKKAPSSKVNQSIWEKTNGPKQYSVRSKSDSLRFNNDKIQSSGQPHAVGDRIKSTTELEKGDAKNQSFVDDDSSSGSDDKPSTREKNFGISRAKNEKNNTNLKPAAGHDLGKYSNRAILNQGKTYLDYRYKNGLNETKKSKSHVFDKRRSDSITKDKQKGYSKSANFKTGLPISLDKELSTKGQKDFGKSPGQKNNFVSDDQNKAKASEREVQKIRVSSLVIQMAKKAMPDSLDPKMFTLNLLQKNLESNGKKRRTTLALAAGIGINQFFPIYGQFYSGINQEGQKGNLSDYTPIPMLRIYFSKKFYLEVESEFNAPQFVKSDLTVTKGTTNTIGSSVIFTTRDSAKIQKLFYFDAPLSIHYSLFRNFYLGAGVQFSKLNDGAGFVFNRNDSSINGHYTYIYTSERLGNLNSSATYNDMKKNEWRFLIDINYQWKDLGFGIRFNQSISNFITSPAQEKNRAAIFYLRYTLWKNQNCKSLLAK